jgi:hypothetical protein
LAIRILRLFLLLLSAIVVLAGSTYLALPWLVAQLLPGIAERFGVQVASVIVRRPTLTSIQIEKLEAGSEGVSIKASNVRVDYRLSRLLEGELEQLTLAQLLVSVTEEESAAADKSAADKSAADKSAAGGAMAIPDLAGLFAAIPFRAMTISQLTLEVPEVGFVGTGDLSYQDQQFQFAIYGIDPEPAQLLVLRGRVNAQGLLTFDLGEFDPEEKVFLAAESILTGTQLAVSATIDLAGYPLQLVRSLLLLPAGDGDLNSRLTTQVQLPFDADTLSQLDLQGDFALNWRSADEQLQLQGLSGSGHYRAGDVQAVFSAGTIQYQHESFTASATLAPSTRFTWTGDSLQLGAGTRFVLQAEDQQIAGVSDVLKVELQPQQSLAGSFDLELVTAEQTFNGLLAVQAALQAENQVTASGNWRMAGFDFPFELRYGLDSAAGELRSAATLKITAPLAETLLPDWQQDFDLRSGRLDYELELGWSDDLTGALRLQLQNVGAQYDEDLISGINGRLDLAIEPDGLTLAPGKITARSFNPGVELTDLQATVSWSGDRVNIEQGAFSALGGRVEMSDFSVDIEKLNTAFVLDLKAIDLARVLALEGEDIQGDGQLNGTLPVTLNAGLPSIAGGTIASLPPGGSIRLAPGFGVITGQKGLDFALTALTDYRYTSLAASVDYLEDGELKLGVSLQGRNPEVEKGRPIHYNLNVSENVLVLLRSLRAQSEVTDGLERRVMKSRGGD